MAPDIFSDQLDTLERLLTRSVQISTGNENALPRPGQLALAKDIWGTLTRKAGLAGIAPTGTGKSYAHMTCAALAAIDLRERTVISTDSLALQAQFMEKDLPVVAQAAEDLFGFTLAYAVLKGVNNYVDPVKALNLAHELTGKIAEVDFQVLIKELEAGNIDTAYVPAGRGDFSPAKKLAKLAAWALGVYLDDSAAGDRESCPANHTADDWSLVSASSEEKADEADTGFIPKADTAKELASVAHIVVTNHTLLGMQAARSIPVVLGSRKLGRFHNIIVDEGHTLPAQVRSRGASEVSARTVMAAARATAASIEDRWIVDDGERLAKEVSALLERTAKQIPKFEDALRIPSDDPGPIEQILEDILDYTNSLGDKIDRAESATDLPAMLQKLRRSKAAVDRLAQAAEQATEPSPHVARWVTKGSDGFPARFESSPVDVAALIYHQLWNADPLDDVTKEEQEEIEKRLEEGESNRKFPLGVAVVSATLPTNFHMQIALAQDAGEYASPFGEAYAGSAMFIPQCISDSDINALKREGAARLSFDTYRHEEWCKRHITFLVEANDGSALILAAKSSSGKAYAKMLREKLPHLTVHSQWDGGQVSRIVQAWREDKGSVLVGTKSLMTGVDAPGETNTLVIIDRPPRAAKNVIDEARVEQIIERVGDKWAADRLVYVADAGLLLDQSVGRLIRSTSDRGMVAVLDPRLMTNQWSAFTYNTQVRHEFVKPLLKFGSKFNDLEQATTWLKARKAASVSV